jgi:DNA-binding NtrC family response regulator
MADHQRDEDQETVREMLQTATFDDPGAPRKDLKGLLDDYERKLILLALDASGGHQRRAAASLGLLPSTLSQKMKRLGVRRRVQVAWTTEERASAQGGATPEIDSEADLDLD